MSWSFLSHATCRGAACMTTAAGFDEQCSKERQETKPGNLLLQLP
jgi:hypothetical protein